MLAASNGVRQSVDEAWGRTVCSRLRWFLKNCCNFNEHQAEKKAESKEFAYRAAIQFGSRERRCAAACSGSSELK